MDGTSTNNLEVESPKVRLYDEEVKIELMVVSVKFGSHLSFSSLRIQIRRASGLRNGSSGLKFCKSRDYNL